MDVTTAYFYIKNFIDSNKNKGSNETVLYFEKIISSFNDKDLENLILFSGFIPDLYEADSSEETLFSKLVEVLIAVSIRKLGFHSEYIKTKASYEDVKFEISNKIIVCDVKSFRLGRSQKAPNVKDFIKLEDIKKWLARYKNKKLGGLVIYPDSHEWTSGSDAYQYCSTKETPTVMLPYKYIALLLKYKNNIKNDSILNLWNYNVLFPDKLSNKKNNKSNYWNILNKTIRGILNITEKEFSNTLENFDNKIKKCIEEHIKNLTQHSSIMKENIKRNVNMLTPEKAKKEYIEYKTRIETEPINKTIRRIKTFRL